VGQVIYGVGCGALTVIFRYFGLFPEGVTYAILLMNLCVWTIDRYTASRIYGHGKGGAPRG
jgi:electron transport complex protein RnfD